MWAISGSSRLAIIAWAARLQRSVSDCKLIPNFFICIGAPGQTCLSFRSIGRVETAEVHQLHVHTVLVAKRCRGVEARVKLLADAFYRVTQVSHFSTILPRWTGAVLEVKVQSKYQFISFPIRVGNEAFIPRFRRRAHNQ